MEGSIHCPPRSLNTPLSILIANIFIRYESILNSRQVHYTQDDLQHYRAIFLIRERVVFFNIRNILCETAVNRVA